MKNVTWKRTIKDCVCDRYIITNFKHLTGRLSIFSNQSDYKIPTIIGIKGEMGFRISIEMSENYNYDNQCTKIMDDIKKLTDTTRQYLSMIENSLIDVYMVGL